jgi:hypothetical protein
MREMEPGSSGVADDQMFANRRMIPVDRVDHGNSERQALVAKGDGEEFALAIAAGDGRVFRELEVAAGSTAKLIIAAEGEFVNKSAG